MGVLTEYRLPGQKRWSQALVWAETNPGAALADALEIPEVELIWRSVSTSPDAADADHATASADAAATSHTVH